MLKKLFASLVLLIGAVGAANASSLEEIRDASHILYRDNINICSGTFISPRVFLTAGHCIYGSNSQYTIKVGKEVIPLDLKSKSTDHDVAILQPRVKGDFDFVDIEFGYEPELGEEIYSTGYAFAEDFVITKGLVSTEIFGKGGVSLKAPGYTYSALLTPGMSGGGTYKRIGDDFVLIGSNSFGNGSLAVSAHLEYILNNDGREE